GWPPRSWRSPSPPPGSPRSRRPGRRPPTASPPRPPRAEGLATLSLRAARLEGSAEKEERMRIAELSQRSGVPIPTIKYYMREGLLYPGERTSRNQARYTESHIQRLRLIRALVDVGHLSIAATREVVASIDAP